MKPLEALVFPSHGSCSPLDVLVLWRLKSWEWFFKCHGPSEPFQWAQWVKNPSVFGLCMRESPRDWPLQRSHTPLPESMLFLSSLHLTLHLLCLLPHQFPQSFSTYCTNGGLGCVAQMFSPKWLESYFSSVFIEQMFPFIPPSPHTPQLLKPFSAPESTSRCCCVFDQESTEWEQENRTLMTVWHASSCMCVCSFSLCSHYSCEQMFSTGPWAVLSQAPYTSASAYSPASG